MKEKTKKTMKVIIIVIAVIAALIIIQALYQIIGMSLVYNTTPGSELRVKIENYIEEYNRTCDDDKQIILDNFYEGGPYIHCNIKFSEEISAEDDAIIVFYLTLHNDLGYDNFCNAEINSDFFRKYDEVYFDFENIRLVYGDKKTLQYPLDPDTDPEDIDAAIYGIGKTIDAAPDTIDKFKGTVYISQVNYDTDQEM